MEKLFEQMKPFITFTYEKNPSIHIKDSYKVKSNDEIMYILNRIHEMDDYKKLQEIGYTRTLDSEFQEWKAHNVLYRLGVAPARTGSVDIDQNESAIRKFGYAILSMF